MAASIQTVSSIELRSYRAGRTLRRLITKLFSAYESRSLKAQVNVGYFALALAAKACLIISALFLAVVLGLLVIMGFAIALLIAIRSVANPRPLDQDPGPDYLGADLYIGDYDSHGHYIGDFKSPD